jgi:hypothetical protein
LRRQDVNPGHLPPFDFQVNSVPLTVALTGQILLAWLKLLALDGDLAGGPSPRRCSTGC